MQPHHRRPQFSPMLVVKVVLVIAFIAILLPIIISGKFTYSDIFSIIPQTCSVGVTGTAANLTISGINAESVCNGLVSNSSRWYLMSEQPQGTELCEGQYPGGNTTTHYIVRDTGILDLEGQDLCSRLSRNEELT